MAFQTSFELVNGDIAKITLSGKLDTLVTPQFQEEINKAIDYKAKRLVLIMKDLKYISSSGLRIIIFYKQKMGPLAEIIVVSPQPLIKEILELTGFRNGLTIFDEYNAEAVENLSHRTENI